MFFAGRPNNKINVEWGGTTGAVVSRKKPFV